MEPWHESVGTCSTCGKKCFPSRKQARHWSKTHFPGVRFSVYRCGGYWHYGHIPLSIKAGATSREAYAGEKRRRMAREARYLARQEARDAEDPL